jgi:hypothetical protein
MKKHLDDYQGRENPFLRDFLIKLGGKNPFGFPNFRLVESERVLEKKGGNWHDWDENLTADERAPIIRKTITVREEKEILGKIVPVDVERSIVLPGNTPWRVIAEVREIPKYSHLDTQGWILEKWFAPELFGGEEFWTSQIVPGTTVPLLGPYPERGVYEMIAGVFPFAPECSFLEQFISFHTKRSREMQESDARKVMNQKTDRLLAAEQQKNDEATQHILDKIKGPLLGTSLAAGRLRNEMAERAGIRSHMGN